MEGVFLFKKILVVIILCTLLSGSIEQRCYAASIAGSVQVTGHVTTASFGKVLGVVLAAAGGYYYGSLQQDLQSLFDAYVESDAGQTSTAELIGGIYDHYGITQAMDAVFDGIRVSADGVLVLSNKVRSYLADFFSTAVNDDQIITPVNFYNTGTYISTVAGRNYYTYLYVSDDYSYDYGIAYGHISSDSWGGPIAVSTNPIVAGLYSVGYGAYKGENNDSCSTAFDYKGRTYYVTNHRWWDQPSLISPAYPNNRAAAGIPVFYAPNYEDIFMEAAYKLVDYYGLGSVHDYKYDNLPTGIDLFGGLDLPSDLAGDVVQLPLDDVLSGIIDRLDGIDSTLQGIVDGVATNIPITSTSDLAMTLPTVAPADIPAVDRPITDTDDPPVDPDDPDQPDLPPGDVASYVVDLREIFPFCLPFDFVRLVSAFKSDPVTPSFTVDYPYMSQGHISTHTIVLDLSIFDGLAALLRRLEIIAFCVGLIFATSNIIRW